MQNTLGLEDVINEWSGIIANDISERRFYDIKEVAAYAKVKLLTALEQCILIQVSKLDAERLLMVKEYASPATSVYRKSKLMEMLAEINIRIKERNAAASQADSLQFRGNPILKEKKVKIVRPFELVCKLKEVSPIERFKEAKSRKFFAFLSYGQNGAESNVVCFTLRGENCSLLDDFTTGDMLLINYNIVGSQFYSNNKSNPVYVTTLIANKVRRPDTAE